MRCADHAPTAWIYSGVYNKLYTFIIYNCIRFLRIIFICMILAQTVCVHPSTLGYLAFLVISIL